MSDPTQENIGNISNTPDVQAQGDQTTVFEKVNDTIGGIEANVPTPQNETQVVEQPDTTAQTTNIPENTPVVDKKDTDKQSIHSPIGKFKRRNKLPYTFVDFFGLNNPSYLEDITREARKAHSKKAA